MRSPKKKKNLVKLNSDIERQKLIVDEIKNMYKKIHNLKKRLGENKSRDGKTSKLDEIIRELNKITTKIKKYEAENKVKKSNISSPKRQKSSPRRQKSSPKRQTFIDNFNHDENYKLEPNFKLKSRFKHQGDEQRFFDEEDLYDISDEVDTNHFFFPALTETETKLDNVINRINNQNYQRDFPNRIEYIPTPFARRIGREPTDFSELFRRGLSRNEEDQRAGYTAQFLRERAESHGIESSPIVDPRLRLNLSPFSGGSLISGGSATPGPATPGPATPGPATPGTATSGTATSGRPIISIDDRNSVKQALHFL